MRTLPALTVLLCASAATISAATIVDNYSANNGSGDILSAAVAFTLPDEYVNVSISARLCTVGAANLPGNISGTAMLLTKLGPAAVPSDIVAQTNFQTDFPAIPGIGPSITLFDFGSAVLDPGTYYLALLAGPGNSNGILWQSTLDGPVLGSGVTIPFFSYLKSGPGATFQSQFSLVSTNEKLQYLVTGDLAPDGEVPEPSTWLLLTTGLGAIIFRKR